MQTVQHLPPVNSSYTLSGEPALFADPCFVQPCERTKNTL